MEISKICAFNCHCLALGANLSTRILSNKLNCLVSGKPIVLVNNIIIQNFNTTCPLSGLPCNFVAVQTLWQNSVQLNFTYDGIKVLLCGGSLGCIHGSTLMAH